MAALATRLGQASLTGLNNVTASSKLLAVTAVNNKVSKNNIYSKTSGMIEPRKKPWPYKTLGFNYWHSLMDVTVNRFNDNSKLIVVEGPPALEKTKFAKELADELDMVYVSGANMEEFYINSYGYDLRELDHLWSFEKNMSFDEKKFAQDPTAYNGGLDRMQYELMHMHYCKYVDALAHIFNTGQGIVIEKSPHSEFVFTEACYKMGWIDKLSRMYMNKIRRQAVQTLLRPNLIIYLDAPVEVVQQKIRERSKTTHPWEKNSPVYENTEYLKLLYDDLMKKQYIKEASIGSRVLMYDWSEGGETEVVVEDIERLNMDYFDKYDKQQEDWRMLTEDNYSKARIIYTNRRYKDRNFNVEFLDNDRIRRTADEYLEFQFNAHKVPGNKYIKGFNEDLGDGSSLIRPFLKMVHRDDVYYKLDALHIDNDRWTEYERAREAKKEAGQEKWWQF